MTPESLLAAETALPALLLLMLTGVALLAGRNIRWLGLILGVQYLGVFLLTLTVWSVGLALVKLAAGWMAALILSVGERDAPPLWQAEEDQAPSGSLFRLLAAGLVILTMFTLSSRLMAWYPLIGRETAIGGSLLIGLGLLHLGLSAHPLRFTIGLLTAVSGFEVLYASLERSLLLAGLLAGLNIGLALVGVYLLAAPAMEEAE